MRSERGLLLLLGAMTLMGAYVVLGRSLGSSWILDLLTGLAAALTGFMVCVRLAIDAPSRAAHRIWQGVLIVLGLILVGQIVAAFSDHGVVQAGAELVGIGLLALAVFLVTWMNTGADPLPTAARNVLWLALAVQIVAVVVGAAGHRALPDFIDLLSMQLYLLSAALFVAHLRRQVIAVNRHASGVGDLARYLFVTSNLFKEHRYPRIGRFPVPGGKLGLGLVRFFAWYFPHAPQVRAKFGRSRWAQFLDICEIGLRHGLDPQAYYMFELYREPSRSRASGFLTRFETKNGLLKVLTWQVPKSHHRTPLGDKLATYRLCEQRGIPTVPILMVAEEGKLQVLCDGPGDLAQDLLIKPRRMKGARGIEVFRSIGETYVDAHGAPLTYDELSAFIAGRSREGTVLVQPWVKNHPDLADLADQSLIPIRVITCLNDAGKPVVTHGMLRVISKLEPGWTTDAELGAPVDLRSGLLGKMTGDKPEMAFDWYENHPVTNARVLGRVVPHWNEVCAIALAAHAACEDRLLVGWDVAIGPGGPLLLEGNSYADVDFLQRVHRCSIGDSPLGPLLLSRLIDLERRIATRTLRGPFDFDPVQQPQAQ